MYSEGVSGSSVSPPFSFSASEGQTVAGGKSSESQQQPFWCPPQSCLLPPGEAVDWKTQEIKNWSRVIAEKFHSVIFLFIALSIARP